ncbi:hypothetical protein EV646_10676 [Kribbella antiqua]|uniref:Uncharacterized protein n=1 Tax=Kribbella antiqua TaxID=2512217 RepID=A0A4R2IPJ2_9ACTN|nr:hypothetical protein [Kribbella antiqua]TCO46837.1 hypothetical protein EV646_10676 [Kribbella antiqua]
MTPSEKISLWLAQVRAAGEGAVAARLSTAVAGAVALGVAGAQGWDQLDLVPLIAIPMLLATVVLPDSLAGLTFIVVVAGGWLMRAPAEISLSLVVTGIALLVVHLATAFAAQIPSYARVHRDALRRWLLPGAIALVLGPVVAVAAALVQGAHVSGSLLVTVAALLLATATLWFASGQSFNRD